MRAGGAGPRAAAGAAAALLALTLASCGAVPGAPVGLIGADREGEAEPPALRASPRYETADASVDVPVPPAALSRWLGRAGAPFLAGIGAVAGAPAGGGWRAPGERGRLALPGGMVATAEVLAAGPGTLRVELWGLSGRIGRYVAYAVEDVALSEAPSGTRVGTHVNWTVAFEPVFQPPDGWVIRSWVRDDVRASMQAGLDAMAARAARDLLPRSDAGLQDRP